MSMLECVLMLMYAGVVFLTFSAIRKAPHHVSFVVRRVRDMPGLAAHNLKITSDAHAISRRNRTLYFMEPVPFTSAR